MAWKRDKITDEQSLLTLRISPSSINQFKQCPRKWFYTYIEALAQKDTLPLLRGSAVHYTLENVFDFKALPEEGYKELMYKKAIKLLDSQWKEMKINDLDLPKEEIQNGYDESVTMIDKFLTKFCDNIADGVKYKYYKNPTQGYYFTRPSLKELWLDDQFQSFLTAKNKKDFTKKEKIPLKNSLNVGGFIDSVLTNFNKETILIDYKTSKKYKDALSEEYVLQLSIYAYLWFVQFGKFPDYVAIDYLRYGESFFIKVTPDLIKHAVDEIKQMRRKLIENGLDKENYYKKASKLCDWCAFKDKCTGIKDE